MNKKIWTRIGVVFLVVLGTVLFAIGYQMVAGTRIRHYKQFVLPCRGRVCGYSSAYVEFDILDEKEISELSNSKNICYIRLQTKDGEKLSATEWTIYDESTVYRSKLYFGKCLRIGVDFDKTQTITKLEIAYPDKTEIFDIGELTLEMIGSNSHEVNTEIFSMLYTQSSRRDFADIPDVEMGTPICMEVSAHAMSRHYCIQKVDFGIAGLGIEPKTWKETKELGGIDFDDPRNQEYNETEVVAQLPNQRVQIEVTEMGEDKLYGIVAIRNTEEYKATMTADYYAPIYTCTDLESGEEYTYGNVNYYISRPLIRNDEIMTQLLEEHGQ